MIKIQSLSFPFKYLSLFTALLFSLGTTQTKIATIGNSITQGSGLSNKATQSYTALINKRFGNNITVTNYGLSGRTLLKNGDQPYWNESEFKNLFITKPNIITLMLGTNDTKPQNWDTYSTEFKPDLIDMIDTLSTITPKPTILLVLPPAITTNNFGIDSLTLQNEIIPIIKQVAKEKSLGIIDVNTPFLNKMNLAPDGVHPKVEGHKLIADVFEEGIQNLALNRNPPEKLLWYGNAPGSQGETAKDKPRLYIYPAPDSSNSGIGVIICPGGAYINLAMAKEGHDIAKWFNKNGISAFVLQYRLRPYRHPIELNDSKRAMRIVRQLAPTYGVDSTKIGIMGFSAGGHLASTLLTHFDAGDSQNTDPIERFKSRPDFGALIYPVITLNTPYTHVVSKNSLLGSNSSNQELIDSLSNHLQVTSQTPQTFLAHGDKDNAVPIQNSQLFDSALTANGVNSKFVVDPGKGHGYGMKGVWPDSLLAWVFQSVLVDISQKKEFGMVNKGFIKKQLFLKNSTTKNIPSSMYFYITDSPNNQALKPGVYNIKGTRKK